MLQGEGKNSYLSLLTSYHEMEFRGTWYLRPEGEHHGRRGSCRRALSCRTSSGRTVCGVAAPSLW